MSEYKKEIIGRLMNEWNVLVSQNNIFHKNTTTTCMRRGKQDQSTALLEVEATLGLG